MYLKVGWVECYVPEGGLGRMLCTWRWVESDAMYLKLGWVGCYVPEDGLGRILFTWRWVESDAIFLKVGLVGCYVPEGELSRMLCTWRWVGSDTMYLKVGWVGCYVPEDGLGRILCTWSWVESDAMYLKVGWVGCYVYLNVYLKRNLNKRSRYEPPSPPAGTGSTVGCYVHEGGLSWVGYNVPEVELGRIQCTWSWVGSDTMYLKVGWVECYVPAGGLGRILCPWTPESVTIEVIEFPRIIGVAIADLKLSTLTIF